MEFMQESIVFLLRVQCRRKESSRSLSHLLTSFLLYTTGITSYKLATLRGLKICMIRTSLEINDKINISGQM